MSDTNNFRPELRRFSLKSTRRIVHQPRHQRPHSVWRNTNSNVDTNIRTDRRLCHPARGGGGAWRRGVNRFSPSSRGWRGHPSISSIRVCVLRELLESDSFWYKVSIPYGGKYDQNWVMKSLRAGVAPYSLTPICYTRLETKEAFFFIDEHKVASKLSNMDRTVSTQDGYKLRILVESYTPQQFKVDNNLSECLKLALNKRFNPETNALNLSKLHQDPDLLHKFVPLNHQNVLSAVLNMVVNCCPKLHALDLSDNMIYNLDAMKPFVARLSHLQILHLANNQINHVLCLDSLRGLDLQELVMNSNPILTQYEDRGAYVSVVRKRFPKLRKLDGVSLPSPILFDVQKTQLPRSKGSFLPSNDGKEMARQFLQQYFSIFDTNDRNLLREAYHETAMVSMTMLHPRASHGQRSSQPRNEDTTIEKSMSDFYLVKNLNIERVADLDKRIQNLFLCGHNEILEFLSNFPSTQHDPLSFAVDLLLFTPQLIQICVTGVFRETKSSSNARSVPIRAFNRCLVIAPQGQGFCILNELLTITNATKAQSRAAFKTTSVLAPSTSPAVAPVSATSVVEAHNGIKYQMVEHLAKVSGMNLSWSEKCLNETNWNIDQALLAFTELFRVGNIPGEAFIQ